MVMSLLFIISCGLRSESWAHVEDAVGKAEHSESVMKRDSEVCWSGMSLSLLQDPSQQWRKEPVIEYCCWAIVKLQLNSFFIIITICFPYGWRWEDEILHNSRGARSGRVFLCSDSLLVFSPVSVLVTIASWLHLLADSCHWSYLTSRLLQTKAAALKTHSLSYHHFFQFPSLAPLMLFL